MKGSWHGGGHGHWLSSTDVMSNATAMEVNFFFFLQSFNFDETFSSFSCDIGHMLICICTHVWVLIENLTWDYSSVRWKSASTKCRPRVGHYSSVELRPAM